METGERIPNRAGEVALRGKDQLAESSELNDDPAIGLVHLKQERETQQETFLPVTRDKQVPHYPEYFAQQV